jgi:two-component system sensor histidine kinase BaeS
VRGELVALARMFKLRVVSDDIDAKFLNSQYGGIVGVALALLVLALASAWWVARRWVRPLLAAQDATLRIAQGEFAIRLNPSRTDEIGDLMRNINAMAQALAQLDAQRRRWIADISHELRTPLAVLRGEIEALVDGVRPLQPAAMVSLREEVLHLGALVEDLHLLAMSDLKALPCYFEEQDALALAQKVLQRFELRAQQLGLSLQLSAPQQDRVPVRWDGRRIEQLLGNLLDNSLRYTDAPGRVRLTLQIDAGDVLIDLEDSAPGVPAADAARLFEPLYRADAARSRHTGGSGLGLAICHAIVQAHGGAITATASELGGLQVRIRLPRLAGEGAC